MSLGLEKYRAFIDALVKRRDGVLPLWIRTKGWPKLPENDDINAFLSKLSREEKELVVRIAREARDGGIHDTLVVIQESMDSEDLRITIDDVELPVSPYGTELFWDWVARADGTPWPQDPD